MGEKMTKNVLKNFPFNELKLLLGSLAVIMEAEFGYYYYYFHYFYDYISTFHSFEELH